MNILSRSLNKKDCGQMTFLKQIKLHNGSIQEIPEISEDIRSLFKETFDIHMKWIIRAASRRAKWIDQSASTNIFVNTTSGKYLNDIYSLAWTTGLKTTYYLRSLGATQISKTSADVESTSKEPELETKPTIKAESVSLSTNNTENGQLELMMCKLNDPTCEACE